MKKLFLIIVLLLTTVPAFGQWWVNTDLTGLDSLCFGGGWRYYNHKLEFGFRTGKLDGTARFTTEAMLSKRVILSNDKILMKCKIDGGTVHGYMELFNDMNPSFGTNIVPINQTGIVNVYLFQLPSGVINVNRMRITFGYYPFESNVRIITIDSIYTTLGVTLFDPTITSTDKTKIPISFTVSQNFPNPFNPATKIRVSLPASQVVRAVVYNQLGEEVAVIADGEFTAGEHEILFNGANLPSGLYICRVSSGEQQQIIKMTLMK